MASKFSAQHYNAIAKVVRENGPTHFEDQFGEAAVDKIVVALAAYFQHDNPAFKPEQFFAACQPVQPDVSPGAGPRHKIR